MGLALIISGASVLREVDLLNISVFVFLVYIYIHTII